MTWPMVPEVVTEFRPRPRSHHRGRGKALAHGDPDSRTALRQPKPPAIIGKKDENGEQLFPAKGALDPNSIAIAIGERLLEAHKSRTCEAVGR